VASVRVGRGRRVVVRGNFMRGIRDHKLANESRYNIEERETYNAPFMSFMLNEVTRMIEFSTIAFS
jgi:hypothetical protein